MAQLPVDLVLPAVAAALDRGSSVVLSAPPGAGKTTRVPIALLHAPWLGGQRIVMLEPRRVAARAAARFMARSLHEEVGGVVGYRTRLDSRSGRETRIDVVTEGILTRMLASDPGLDGAGLLIFDEFHERSLHADTGLALAIACRDLLRPDLRILVMSATLDGARVAELLGNAEMIVSEGRQYPVAVEYHPGRDELRIEGRVARVIRQALHESPGDVLAFLPGTAEIRRTAAMLDDLDPDVVIRPLHGTLPPADQDLALEPDPSGRRKVILATSIAETSLTIDGVRVVVDSGLARTARFSPRTGLTRLTTVRASQAATHQRAGRAGRQGAGTCHRVWAEHEQLQLPPWTTPEILEADLAPMVLSLAAAGAGRAESLRWLDPPPESHLAQARQLLVDLGAIAPDGAILPHGEALVRTGLHPRLAHMLHAAAAIGQSRIGGIAAALLEERDLLRGDGAPADPDFRLRVELVLARGTPSTWHGAGVARDALARVRSHAAQLARRFPGAATPDVTCTGLVTAFAYPDRIAQRRPGTSRFVMRNGRGAVLATPDALAGCDYIVALDLDDQGAEGRIFSAAPLELPVLLHEFAGQVTIDDQVTVDAEGAVAARRARKLGALTLEEHHVSDPDPVAVASTVVDHLRHHGPAALDPAPAFTQLRERIAFLRQHDPAWPDVGDAALVDLLEQSMADRPRRIRHLSDLAGDLTPAMLAALTRSQRAGLDALAPTHIVVPSGSHVSVNYRDPARPVLAVRLQEMFGLADTPCVLGGRVPLTLHLLSPAHRPVQVTQDLGGFWRSSYADVRKDLRGRYPRHEWPLDPMAASPTRRAKPRKR